MLKDQAMRFNGGKVEFSQIPLHLLEDGARVLMFGAQKYARNNWKKGLPVNEIIDSLMRHLSALQRGEYIDPESGLPHHGHMFCNWMFLTYVLKHKPEFIDIPELLEAIKEYEKGS